MTDILTDLISAVSSANIASTVDVKAGNVSEANSQKITNRILVLKAQAELDCSVVIEYPTEGQ